MHLSDVFICAVSSLEAVSLWSAINSCGGVAAAMSGNLVSALNTEILIPLFEFPSTNCECRACSSWLAASSAAAVCSGMWIGLRDAALSGHPITGIMNPNSGPYANEGSEQGYQAFLNEEMKIGDGATDDSDDAKPMILCYIATGYGDQAVRPAAGVIAEIAVYDEVYPGVCEGIFFDEAASSGMTNADGTLTDIGQHYYDYNEAALAVGKTVTFNPGAAADPIYYGWEGRPTVMGFEDGYSRVENVGIRRTPTSATPDQNVMLVHTATELEGDSSLVKAMVQKAACSGWGKLYFTGSTFADNPWNEVTLFWDDLVTEVSQDIDITCPDSAESQMRIMVPLLPDPVPSASDLDDMVAPLLAVLSKSDYGDVVSVALDASDATMLGAAVDLRDAGARILCYLDAAGLSETTSLSNTFDDDYVSEVCGGFFVDNFDTVVIGETETDNLYANSQFKVPGGTVVFRPADDSADTNAYLYDNDWDQVSFQLGRVIVATVVDGATSTAIPPAAGARRSSAVMMTGFGETFAHVVIADMAAASYGHAYVTEAADFATLTSHWATLVRETTATTACGTEAEATLTWLSGSRKLRIKDGGCVDMSRMRTYFADNQITDVLSQVEPGVWELDGTIDVRVDSTLKIVGQSLGECDELRLISNSPRSRLLGNGGNIVIQDTKIYGWKETELDQVESNNRGYILCSSCAGSSSDECTMTVTDSTIKNLGSGGVNTGGLAWRDDCTAKGLVSAQRVTITDNRRGIYAKGADVNFDDLVITGGGAETIRIDECTGHVSTCTATPSSSKWGIILQRSTGIKITENRMIGTKGIYLANTDALQVTGNILDPSSNAVRVRTTNTVYSDNTGDGVYVVGGSTVGVRVQGGCFDPASTSLDTAVQDYINSNICT